MRHEADIAGYDAEPVECHACRAREEEAAQFSGGQKAGPLAGVYFTVAERRNGDSGGVGARPT